MCCLKQKFLLYRSNLRLLLTHQDRIFNLNEENKKIEKDIITLTIAVEAKYNAYANFYDKINAYWKKEYENLLTISTYREQHKTHLLYFIKILNNEKKKNKLILLRLKQIYKAFKH